ERGLEAMEGESGLEHILRVRRIAPDRDRPEARNRPKLKHAQLLTDDADRLGPRLKGFPLTEMLSEAIGDAGPIDCPEREREAPRAKVDAAEDAAHLHKLSGLIVGEIDDVPRDVEPECDALGPVRHLMLALFQETREAEEIDLPLALH